MVHQIKCSEIWGGIQGDELEAKTSGLHASLFSQACDGGKGGDIYYISVCASDLLTRIALADVMGHGEKVSHTSQTLYHSLEANMNSADGTQVLTDLNRTAIDYGIQAITTAVVAAFYRADSNLYFSYAGHHDVLMNRRGAADWQGIAASEAEGLSNLPLGVDEDTNYVQSQAPLSAGDRLFLYTDGVIEAPDQTGTLFGENRLRDVLQQSSSDSLNTIRNRVHTALLEHTGNNLIHDDVTFMTIEIRE